MRRTLLSLVLVTVPVVASAQRAITLVPQPRELRADHDIALTRGLDVVIPPDSADALAARDLRDALKEAGIPLATRGGSARIVLLRAGSPAARALLARRGVACDSAMQRRGDARD